MANESSYVCILLEASLLHICIEEKVQINIKVAHIFCAHILNCLCLFKNIKQK